MMNYRHVRKQFDLDPKYIHLSNGVVAPHPKVVRLAIDKYRKAFDSNPALFVKNRQRCNQDVLNAIANYLDTSNQCIALVESTTMGLSLLYHGINLSRNDEVVSTVHDHYATQETLRFKCKTSGAILKQIPLYDDSFGVQKENIISHLLKGITDKTRVVALTWVHSSTGVKLPIAEMGDAIKEINQVRPIEKQILFCVDGVHALGIEDFSVEKLNCDFFIAGCHKSLFGPRGTGFIWGKPNAWEKLNPIIPSFEDEVFFPWLNQALPEKTAPLAKFCTPGGFNTFEYRWALREAIEFQLALGKSSIQTYVHHLNYQFKLALLAVKSVKLHTPLSPDLSSGIICFELSNKTPNKVVDELLEKNIITGKTPYVVSYCRLMPGICNTVEEIDLVVNALSEIA